MKADNAFTRKINRQRLRIEIGNDDREIWLWPVAIRAPMAHSRIQGGVRIDDSKTSYLLNPSVGYTLGGGFHCTTFECIAQIFREGLRPGGGGGDRINTFFVPFAPWDERSQSVLRFRKIDGADLVYIYLSYESIAKLLREFQQMDTSWCSRRSHSVPLMQYGITTGKEKSSIV